MQHVLRSLLNTKALIKKKFDLEVYETMSVDEQVLIQRGDPELDKTKFEDWDVRMKELDRNLNKASNKNPLQMLQCYSTRFNDGILRNQADESAEWTDPAEIQTSTRERKENVQEKMQDAYKEKVRNYYLQVRTSCGYEKDFVTDRRTNKDPTKISR
ncbi:hypothetical protein CDAR_520851 [Caerostris darwini]|uniref:Uncharacterized protein n=1 Tax=Caerostris darwini TaxID=1538125 RepID=A0AAV4V489_9ARAC|nr:hypothetical protein CDAR_520851 [Caerostris darwini]